MREIKFRAWDKKFNLMLYPDNFYNEYISADGKVIEIEEWFDYSGGGFLTNDVSQDYILMQYTGLKDKNGKEIYEGDILLFNNSHNDRNNKWKCVVKYREGSFVCEYSVDGVYNHFDSWNVPKVTWEIIGNIYENPELLKGDENA